MTVHMNQYKDLWELSTDKDSCQKIFDFLIPESNCKGLLLQRTSTSTIIRSSDELTRTYVIEIGHAGDIEMTENGQTLLLGPLFRIVDHFRELGYSPNDSDYE